MKRSMVAIAACLALGGIASAEWYSNGNLHNKKMRDWKRATEQNRLATAADMVAKIYPPANRDHLNTITKLQAVALVRCIDEGGADAHSNNLQVAELAAACLIIMKGQGVFR